MKYEIKVRLIDSETGETLFYDSITYHENMLEMALEFVVKLANASNKLTRYEFEIIKEEK